MDATILLLGAPIFTRQAAAAVTPRLKSAGIKANERWLFSLWGSDPARAHALNRSASCEGACAARCVTELSFQV